MSDKVLNYDWQLPNGTKVRFFINGDGCAIPYVCLAEQPINIKTAVGDSVDAFIQDQHSPLVNVLMHQDLAVVTLASATVIDSRTIELEAGHGASAAEQLYLIEGSQFYQGIITNVSTNTLTMDTPMGKVFTVAANTVRANPDMSVNGSSTPAVFHIKPPPDVPAWDITRLSISITDNAEMDDTKFGALAALANGVLLRKNNGDGTYTNIGNAKTNGDLRLLCDDGAYAAKAGAGKFGFNVKCVFQPSVGVVIRLNPALGEDIEIIIQDNLTDLLTLTAVAQGHEVVN